MSGAFLDIPLPDGIQGIPCQVGPRFSTRIVLAKSGDETRNKNWANPLRKFMLPEAVSDQPTLELALDHWLIMGGPYSTFPFRDPTEFASLPLAEANVAPDITGLDQPLGTGDGTTHAFAMARERTLGGHTYTRNVLLPIVDSVIVLIDGVAPADASGGPYTVTAITRPGGGISISPPPTAGRVLTCGYLFDTEVRWEADDTFDAIVRSLDTTGAGAINLVEVRRC